MSSDLEDLAPDTSTPHRPMSSNNKKRTLGGGFDDVAVEGFWKLPISWALPVANALQDSIIPKTWATASNPATLTEATLDLWARGSGNSSDALTQADLAAIDLTVRRVLDTVRRWANTYNVAEDDDLAYTALAALAYTAADMKEQVLIFTWGYLEGNERHGALISHLGWTAEAAAVNIAERYTEDYCERQLTEHGPTSGLIKSAPRGRFTVAPTESKRLRALTDDYMAALAETVAITGVEAAPRPMKSDVILSTSKLVHDLPDWAPQGGAYLTGRKSKDTAVTAGPHPGDLVADLNPARGAQLAHLDYRHVAVSDAIGSLKRAVDGHADTSTRIGLSDIAKHLMGNKRGARLSDELLEEVEALIDDLEATYATVTGTDYNGGRVDLRGHLVTAYKVVFTHPNGATSTGYRVFEAPILFAASEHINQAKQVDAALEGYSPGKRRTLPAMITARWITSYLPYWAATGATRVEVYIEPPTKKPRRPPPVLATALGDKSPLTRRRQRTLTEYLTAALDHLKARGYVTAYEDLYEGRKRVGVTIYLPATMPALDAAKR